MRYVDGTTTMYYVMYCSPVKTYIVSFIRGKRAKSKSIFSPAQVDPSRRRDAESMCRPHHSFNSTATKHIM